MIAELFIEVMKVSLFTTVLIGALLLLIPLLTKRYRAKWRYVAWIVLALRLLIPVNFSLPQAPIRIELPELAAAVAEDSPIRESGGQAQAAEQAAQEAQPADEQAAPQLAAQPAPVHSPLEIAGWVWLAGVALFLLFQVGSYSLFLRRLRAAAPVEIPQYFKETVWRIGVDMGVCKLPDPIITSQIDAPVLIGVLHPRVLLPHVNYTEEELAFILRHELVHYRRRDMWYKLVLLLANALHWFNPLVYLMTVQAAKDIELACDDDVTSKLDRDARARYGNTILAALPKKRRLEPVFSTHFGSTKKNMKSRLRNLFDMTSKRRGVIALCAVVLAASTLTGIVTFAQAAPGPADSAAAPAIAGDHSFTIAAVEPGEVVCLGKITLGPGRSYTAAFSTESGDSCFMALYDEPGITKVAGIGWNQRYGYGSNFYWTSGQPRETYLYVGVPSTGGRVTGIDGELTLHSKQATPPQDSGVKTLAFDVDSTNVVVTLATDGKFHFDYDMDSYTVTTGGTDADKTISIGRKGAGGTDFPAFVNIQIPNTAYRSISYKGNGAGLNLPPINADTSVEVEKGSLSITVPKGFDKTLDYTMRASSGVVTFAQGAVDYVYTLQASAAAPVLPGQWPAYRHGQTYRHQEGGGAGKINGTVDSSSMVVRLSEDEAPSPSSQTAQAGEQFNADFTVERLGRLGLQSGDAIVSSLQWTGGSGIMMLRSANNYTDKDFDDLFMGFILPGLPEAYYGDIDTSRFAGHTFAFSRSVTSPLVWNDKINTNRDRYLYLIRFGNPEALSGTVTHNKAGGSSTVLWQQGDAVPSSGGDNTAFQLASNGGKSITQSAGFEAKAGQTLTITALSDIRGGSVDLFLFSPGGGETQRITFTGSDTVQTIPMTTGLWNYNCTGFFTGGDITITGVLS